MSSKAAGCSEREMDPPNFCNHGMVLRPCLQEHWQSNSFPLSTNLVGSTGRIAAASTLGYDIQSSPHRRAPRLQVVSHITGVSSAGSRQTNNGNAIMKTTDVSYFHCQDEN